ncbi:NUDIX hydrolase [Ancylobacter sp. A5.8]|uniref:NUDIX domain-containing protein n=1 Tax=Ancylobacter gelatini TaxID=2919920 RepID=UPI001F4EABD0|nr:NUDIX hydrolase [Ancylobacter gelatini]MCJ8144603.1 NUDIX hydrolase [Ancylobacter gelatini]
MTDAASSRPESPLRDLAVPVELSPITNIEGDGFRPYHRVVATLVGAGGAPLVQPRDILRVGPCIAALGYDPAAECLVLIHQFRVAGHLATGKGELVELVAGRVEPGESAEHAAARECVEEIGVPAQALTPIMAFMPSPGVTDEYVTLFLALIDSTALPSEAGEPSEAEYTRPFTVPVDEALALLDAPPPGPFINVFVRTALQWVALNRAKMAAFAAENR